MARNFQCKLTNESRNNKFFSVVQERQNGYVVLFSNMCMTHGYLMCNVDVEPQGNCYVLVGDRPLKAGDTTGLEGNAQRLDTGREHNNYTYNMDNTWSVRPY